MMPDIYVSLNSIYRKLARNRKIEEPKEEDAIVQTVFETFQQDSSQIWRCDANELVLIKERFQQLESSDSLSSILPKINQQIEILDTTKRNVDETLALIKKYAIGDKNRLFEIAKLCAKQNGMGTAKNIQEFDITDKNRLFEIAKLCAKQNGRGTADHIQKFDITDKNMLFEIAKLCASKNNEGTSYYIKNFQLTNKDHLFEIAKICAMQNGAVTAEYIQNFGITYKDHLFEIAKICAMQNGAVTAEYIQNFGITYQDHLFEIAKLCASANGWVTAKNIKEFDITNQDRLYEIAKICAMQSGWGIALSIQKFGITNQIQLFEIAKLCASQHGEKTAYYIQKFGITNKNRVFEIAKLCAKQNGRGTADHIQNFDITDKNMLFEIAKICASQCGEGTANYIQNFDITDKNMLFEIAKLCASKNNEGTSYYIKNFQLTNKDHLFEIAKICAMQNGAVTAEYIQNFGITNQDHLFEIAKLCASQCGEGTAKFIQIFGITDQDTDQDRLYEIAKLCAKQNGRGTADLIQKFDITDKNMLFEIAKLCASENGEETEYYIKKFDIKDDANKRTIMLLAIQQNPKSIQFWENDAKEKLPNLFKGTFDANVAKEIINSYITKHMPEKGFEKLVTRIMDMEIKTTDGISAEEKQRIEEELKSVQQNLLQQLGLTLFLLTEQCSEDQIRKVKELQLIEAIQYFRRPDLRWDLTNTLISAASGNALEQITFDEKKSRALRLVDLVQARLIQQGGGKEESSKLIEIIKGDRGLLKNAPTSQVLIEALFRLAEEENLTPEQRGDIINRLTRDIEEAKVNERAQILFKELRSVNSLILMEKPENLINPKDTFDEALEKGFRSLVPLKEVENFTDKYFKTFGTSRNPQAIITYAARIASLNDERATKALVRFVTGVLEGSFQTDRNNVGDNTHLKTIQKNDEEILKKWQKPLDKLHLRDISTTETTKFSPEEWLYKKLVDDSHLPSFEKQLPSLFSYLKRSNKEESVNKYLEEIKRKRLEIIIKTDSPENKNQLTFLDVEQSCLRLLLAEDIVSTIGLLNNLKKNLAKPLLNSPEFLNDAKGLLTELEKTKKKTSVSNFVAVETEDYIDLLLCGTEVLGSCQRIDGDVSLNKGLLGYLLDGKNRLLAIKTQEGDKVRIEARCILRLLWDGEQPVLLRERFYPDPINPEYRTALNELAMRKAEALGVPLVSRDGTGNRYPKTLHALGGPAPFEYSDATGDVQQDGEYRVNNARLIIRW